MSADATPSHLVAQALADLPGVRHGFSFELRGDAEHAAFHQALGVPTRPLVRLRQVHGAHVVDADLPAALAARLEGDAAVATRAGVALAIATADCVPILLADPDARVIGAVHAGWRGTVARVLDRALEAMVARGAEPARLRVAIGPAVHGSCYEVGDEVRVEFERSVPEASRLFNGRRLDLVAAARADLARAGVAEEKVTVVAACTHCDTRLASHRRQGSDRGNNLSVIALAAER